MYLKNLTLNNFKNFGNAEFTFSDINCLVGNNGVGKTNILDAIYYLSFCRSFLASNDSDIIHYGSEFFSVKGQFSDTNDLTKNDTDNTDTYTISLKKGERKVLKHNKQPYKKFSEHIGKIPCVVVSPNDHIYITGRSEHRRKFIDIVLSQTDIVYMDCLIKYNKCLEQRNKLLKQFQQSEVYDTIQLEIWNERLSTCSKIIQEKRKSFFNEFVVPFRHYYQFIADSKERVDVTYKTYDGNLFDILKNNYEKEKILCHTTNGIHRDDLIFSLNEHDVNHIASQGQQKTFVFALKLAQFEYIKKHKKTIPILLLDDIFDKFDFSRVEKILHLVAMDSFQQVFLTDTHQDRIEKIIPINKKNKSIIIKL